MATVTLGLLNHTSIADAESTTGWTTFDTLASDFVKEGSNGIAGTFRSNGTTGYYTAGTAQSASGRHVRIWVNTVNKAFMQPESSGGYEFLMYDGSSTEYKVMFGSDTYDGGWVNYVIDCALFTTLTLANVTRWGVRINHTSNAKNVDNMWVDYIRYLDGYYLTGGTSGDEVDLNLIASRDVDDGAGTLRGYGIVTKYEGVYICTGKLTIGNSSTTTYFKMDGDVLTFSDQSVATNFYEVKADGTVANISMIDSMIKSAGSASSTRFVFDMSNTSVTFSMSGCVLQRGANITFASGQSITNCTFNDCGRIDTNGATFTGCTIKNANVTGTTTGSLLVNSQSEGNACTDLSFSNYTGATTYAVYVDSSVTEFDMDNWQFDDPNNTTSYALYWGASAGTLTINSKNGTNLTSSGCTSAGGTVTVSSPTVLTLTGIPTGTAVSIIKVSDRSEMHRVDSSSGNVVYNYGASEQGVVVDILFVHTSYDPNIGNFYDYTLPSVNTSLPVALVSDYTYLNPT